MITDSLAPGSYIAHLNEQEGLFRRPMSARVMYGIVAAIMSLMIVALSCVFWPGAGPRKPDAVETAIILCTALPLIAVTLLFAAMAGPCEMYFDWGMRTYKYRRGIPLFTKTTSGPVTDFDYLYVGTKVLGSLGSSTVQYMVFLAWKKKPRILGLIPELDFVMYLTAQRDIADSIADSLSGLLKLPVEKDHRAGNQR